MNKADFITCLAGRLPYDKDETEFLVDMFLEVVGEGLKNDRIVKTPFGTFKTVTRKSRQIRTIHDGELTTLPSRDVVIFKPSKKLEEKT
jgi:nucleoid DNA-binding protein